MVLGWSLSLCLGFVFLVSWLFYIRPWRLIMFRQLLAFSWHRVLLVFSLFNLWEPTLSYFGWLIKERKRKKKELTVEMLTKPMKGIGLQPWILLKISHLNVVVTSIHSRETEK
jgi:hypothetical protein